MRILITGGAGNLARYCLTELTAHGHEVTLFARRPPEDVASPWSAEAPIVLGDLTSLEDCRNACVLARPEGVLHLGGVSYASDAEGAAREAVEAGGVPLPEDATFRVNTLGTYHMLSASHAVGARVFVAASTVAVLGRSLGMPTRATRLPIDEDQPVWPTDSYALSKLLSEASLRAFNAAHAMRTVSLRLPWIHMPHEPSGFRMENPLLGRPVRAWSSEHLDCWSYGDARDVATACRSAIEADHLSGQELFYIFTDRSTLEEHRELVRRYYPERLARFAEDWGPDDLVVSMARAKERLGYEPRYSWRTDHALEGH
jgi:nucleoside-diphosphate-sugar epimerase